MYSCCSARLSESPRCIHFTIIITSSSSFNVYSGVYKILKLPQLPVLYPIVLVDSVAIGHIITLYKQMSQAYNLHIIVRKKAKTSNKESIARVERIKVVLYVPRVRRDDVIMSGKKKFETSGHVSIFLAKTGKNEKNLGERPIVVSGGQFELFTSFRNLQQMNACRDMPDRRKS